MRRLSSGLLRWLVDVATVSQCRRHVKRKRGSVKDASGALAMQDVSGALDSCRAVLAFLIPDTLEDALQPVDVAGHDGTGSELDIPLALSGCHGHSPSPVA